MFTLSIVKINWLQVENLQLFAEDNCAGLQSMIINPCDSLILNNKRYERIERVSSDDYI